MTVVANQAAYALPSDFERAIRVEQPDEVIRVFDPGERSSWGYRIWADQLVLAPEPTNAGATQNVRLDYLARFAEPSADGDTISTPPSDDDVLIRLAASLALLWIDSDEAKRQRFERQRGSSARAQAQAYDQQAQMTIEQRRRRLRGTALVVS